MIRLASRQASKSTFERHKLGAVIVKGNRVLSTGYNEIRWNKELHKCNIHAEEAAIVKLLKQRRLADLAGATLYVSRVRPNGSLGLSKPCDSCMALAISTGISRIYYTTNEGTVESYSC